jgi:hypothetical protein
MTLTGARMGGADLIRTEAHDSRLTERRAEGIELALPHIAQLEPVGLGKPKGVPCSRLIGV